MPQLLNVPTISWRSFLDDLDWRQGQHITLIGPNGSGKTVINKELLRYRERRHGYICVFVTKPTDIELAQLTERGYVRTKENRNWGVSSPSRILLWPDAGNFADLTKQRKIFRDALQGAWKAGRWTFMLNELRYLTEHLALKREMNTLYLQARAAKFSLAAETQRPRSVPLEAFSQSTHLFFAACRDDEDLKRISGLGNADSKLIRLTVQRLKQYQFCYVNCISGDVVVTKAKLAKALGRVG
jgi:ABC-type Fe3+/spermidine/putrescine transport system ATPase subunit